MLKNYWYAVEFGHVVTDAPTHVQLMGQQLVLWRDAIGRRAGAVRHLHPPRRFARRRQGPQRLHRVPVPRLAVRLVGSLHQDPRQPRGPADPEEGPDRHLSRVSSATATSSSSSATCPSPNVRRCRGIDVLDEVAIAQTEGFRAITGEFAWKANYERVLENGVDIAHAPFVHAGSFGNPDSPDGRGLRRRGDPARRGAHRQRLHRAPGSAGSRRASGR